MVLVGSEAPYERDSNHNAREPQADVAPAFHPNPIQPANQRIVASVLRNRRIASCIRVVQQGDLVLFKGLEVLCGHSRGGVVLHRRFGNFFFVDKRGQLRTPANESAVKLRVFIWFCGTLLELRTQLLTVCRQQLSFPERSPFALQLTTGILAARAGRAADATESFVAGEIVTTCATQVSFCFLICFRLRNGRWLDEPLQLWLQSFQG